MTGPGEIPKRLFDVVVAVLLIVLLGPLFLIIAVLIKIDSPGPVLFKQKRVGQGGHPLTVYKFRTMIVGASSLGGVTVSGDPRITRIGRWLRAWHLDELPQLFNVAKGDMSFVGPRPELQEYVAFYEPEERRLLEVKPGITGSSTLAYMDEEAILRAEDEPERFYVEQLLHDKARRDLEYLENRSLARDIALLAKTVWGLFSRRRSHQ